jgi:hypothetical protein
MAGARVVPESDAVGLRLHRELARSLYARTVRLQSRLGADALEGRPWLAEARRLVQHMVDLVHEDPSPLVGLTTVKSMVPGGAVRMVRTHAANVAILSVVVAREARLGRNDQVEVGLAGLLHDVGLDATQDTSRHALHGAECLLQLGPVDHVARPALVALEHHLEPEASGGAPAGERDAATRVVRIADAYDTLTARGPSGARPDRVLRFLLHESGSRFDAPLVKLFARSLGAYPPGTTVRLTNGEVGVVLRSCRDVNRLDRPLVRVLRDASGRVLDGCLTVDLAAPSGTRTERRIAASIDPAPLGIAPAAVFLGGL